MSLLAAIVILKHVAYERSFDGFHKKTENLYRLSVSYTDLSGTFGEYPGLSNVLGPKLNEEIPEIVSSVRVFPLREAMRHTIFSSGSAELDVPNAFGIDPSAFEIFTFRILDGSSTGFSDNSRSVSISHKLATSLFGEVDPIGKIVTQNGHLDFVVSSVFEDWPENSHFRPEILLQMRFLEEVKVARPHLHFLGGDKFYTYLKLAEEFDSQILSEKLESFTERNLRPQDSQDAELHLMEFNDIHLKASHMMADMAVVKNGKALNLLVVLAALILLIAWFNFINLVTSGSLQRSKEVAIRRIHGAGRYAMFVQLLLDSFIIVLVAVALAITCNQLLNPRFVEIIGKGSISDLMGNPRLVIGLTGFMLLGVLMAAAYPTMILSAFKNPELIKGKIGNSGNQSWIRKSFVVCQYMITIGLVFGTLTVIQQIKHLKSIETRTDLEQVLVLKGPGVRNPEFTEFRDGIELLKNELKSIPGIETVTTSNFIPGLKMDYAANLSNPRIHGKEPHYIKRIFADESFTKVFDIAIVAGKYFTSEPTENIETRPIVVNESAVRELGYTSPKEIIGERINYWDQKIKVIGVVEDFRMESADQPIEAMFFFPTLDTKFFSMRLAHGESRELIERISNKWASVYPENPFDYFFAKPHFDLQYSSFEQFEKQLVLLTILSISVAILGLLALAFDAARVRMKEVGIRKVLGAGAVKILKLFISDYVRLIGLSTLISVPFAFYLLRNWLDNYANHINIGVGLVLLPIAGILATSVVVIGLQTWKTARSNPVEALRHE